MANTVRKVKRGKTKEFTNYVQPPCIVVSPPTPAPTPAPAPAAGALLAAEMKVTSTTHPEVKNINVVMANTRENAIDSHEAPSTSQTTAHDNNIHFNVNQLIAELSQNSRASKGEIENIQRKLLQQANEILKVNAFANSQPPPPGPRVIDSTQKYSSTAPGYGRIPVIVPRTPSSMPQGPTNAARLPDQADQNKLEVSRQPPHTGSMAVARPESQLGDTQLVPERLQEAPRTHAAGVMINGGHQGNMQRVAMSEGRGSFFYETGLSAAAAAVAAAGAEARGASARDAPRRGVSGVPPYRMPPAPDALPGAPAPPPLHTHSNKFPIERSVILSSAEKGSKVPALDRRRPRLSAVAPDAPPKPHAAWTGTENQQAGTSADFRQYQETYGYAMNQGAIPRTHPGYEPSPKPHVPAKNTAIYGQKLETPNNSQSITVTVETGKDNTRDAPKSTKSVSKTYNTLKDMISSRFKNKDSVDNEKQNESAPALNNSEERKKSEEPVTPRNTEGRKLEQGIYGRPIPQSRPEPQYTHAPNNMAYPSPSTHRLMQQQIAQQQMLLQQARSQEMLASSPHARPMALGPDSPHTRPMALGADSLYQQYGPPGRRSAVYQRDIEARNMANFTSLKQTGMPSQLDNSHTSHSRADLRSPQQLEREIVRHQGLAVGRRAASHPHLLDDPQPRQEITTPQIHDRSRRNSHGNLLERVEREHASSRQNFEERESDDGGFRSRRATQDRSSFEDKARSSGRSLESRHEQQRMQENHYRRTPDSNHRTPDMIHKERRTPDSIHHQRIKEESGIERNDESASQKSADSVYNSSGKTEAYVPQPSSSRHTPSRIEDLKTHGKKGAAGSGASSDYDKNGGVSSNVDSGRGSVAYSSGRAPASPHDTSADSDAARAAPPAVQGTSQTGESEWADIVECELRQILEPRLAGLRLDSSASSGGSVTPPLPPLSPASDVHKRNSLPARGSEYPEERRRGREGGREGREGRDSPRWHGGHKKHSSKRDHHYKKHLFGLDTTDMTSTTTRSLDLSSLLDGRSDSSASGDARAIRRQLRGLETMYAEVLQLLGVRKPQSLPKHPAWESRLSSKRRYGSMSSLPSSSVSSRPRDKRRSSEHRKKHDMKGINKRFQRLESHVVTLARSVAHLSSEMRTQHLVMQEMDNIRAEIQALRHMYKSQQYIRSGHHRAADPLALGDPERVKRLTKFFGDEPPLMRLFLKKLGYEKYAGLLEKEKVGAAELPYVGEDKLRALGVPLGPRMRILKEAGVHSEIHLPRDDHHTTTTLAIV